MSANLKFLLFFFLFLLVKSEKIIAQTLKVESFEEDIFCLTAARGEVVDKNYEPCALLKVQILDESVSFLSDWIIKTESKGQNEFWIWLCEGTRDITIKSDLFLPFELKFVDYDANIVGLKGKHTYVLKLSINMPKENKTNNVSFNCNVADAQLFIDNYPVDKANATYQLTEGKHHIKVTASNYETYEESIVVNPYKKDEQSINVSLRGKMDVKFNCFVEEAMLYVDGQLMGDANETYTILDGFHSIIVKAAGYDVWKKTILFDLSFPKEVYIDLGAYQLLVPVWADSNPIHHGYGFIDSTFNMVIDGISSVPGLFYEGLNVVNYHRDKINYIAIINIRGEKLAELENCSTESRFLEGMIAVKKDEKWGFMDKTGKMITPFKYDHERYNHGRYFYSFKEGLARVRCNFKYVFIDRKGKEVISCHQYHFVSDFSEGLAMVGKNDNYKYFGFIDKTGNEVIPLQKLYACRGFHDGLAAITRYSVKKKKGNVWCGYIDRTGTEVIPCQYKEVSDFCYGLARVKDENHKWGLIDRKGNMVIPCEYDDIKDFSEGMACVKIFDNNSYKYGAIDSTGKLVVPCVYKDFNNYREGLAGVKNSDGKWGFVDKTGKEIIPLIYSGVGYYHNGFAAVNDGKDRWGFIDKTGKEVIPCKYFKAGSCNMIGLFSINDGMPTYIDKTGKKISKEKHIYLE